MIAAVILPVIAGKLTHAKEFIVANCAAALMGTCTFPLIPGTGPWAVYHLAPNSDQLRCAEMIHLLRQPGPFRIDLNYNSGLICFPSFHVILTILSAAALWSVRPLRPFVAIVCVLIMASAVSTGWHYVIDVLGGIGFAAASIGAAKVFTRIEARYGYTSA
jgi:membrane-associated phospholipid phosphatase